MRFSLGLAPYADRQPQRGKKLEGDGSHPEFKPWRAAWQLERSASA
jgi:hypothetical protein